MLNQMCGPLGRLSGNLYQFCLLVDTPSATVRHSILIKGVTLVYVCTTPLSLSLSLLSANSVTVCLSLQVKETEYSLEQMLKNTKAFPKADPSSFELLEVLGQGRYAKVRVLFSSSLLKHV